VGLVQRRAQLRKVLARLERPPRRELLARAAARSGRQPRRRWSGREEEEERELVRHSGGRRLCSGDTSTNFTWSARAQVLELF
jgi:hypothetical protein